MKHLAKLWNRRLGQAGFGVYGGVHDRKAEGASGFGDADNVVNQPLPIDGGDRIHLHRLIVDDDERRVLRRNREIAKASTTSIPRLCLRTMIICSSLPRCFV